MNTLHFFSYLACSSLQDVKAEIFLVYVHFIYVKLLEQRTAIKLPSTLKLMF